jgi:hypothetical protein
MQTDKDVTVYALDEEGLMDAQELHYQCCTPGGYTAACYVGLLQTS